MRSRAPRDRTARRRGRSVEHATTTCLIENVGHDPVYAVAFDLERLATVDLAPPCIAESCGRILPGATRRYTYEELATEPGSTVRVYSWRAVLDGLTPVPGPMHHRDIPIPPIAFP